MTEQQRIIDFVEALSSRQPVPGGGGASALVGGLAAALGLMVGNLTVGKKRYADVEAEVISMMDRLTDMRGEMTRLIDEDGEVFAPLAVAYGLPAGTEEEKEYKVQVMEKNLLAASLVPVRVMELAVDILEILEELEKKGSVMAVSDVGVAAQLARTAVTGAAMNVYINTKSMRDREKAEEINSRCGAAMAGGMDLADRIYDRVLTRLKGNDKR